MSKACTCVAARKRSHAIGRVREHRQSLHYPDRHDNCDRDTGHTEIGHGLRPRSQSSQRCRYVRRPSSTEGLDGHLQGGKPPRKRSKFQYPRETGRDPRVWPTS